MKYPLFILPILALTCIAFSKTTSPVKVGRKIASDPQELVAVVIYGEQFTHFVISSSNGKSTITFDASTGEHSQREINESDFDFIVAQFKALPVPPKVPDDCYRNRADITFNSSDATSQSRASCFGMRTATEPAYIKFINILASAR